MISQAELQKIAKQWNLRDHVIEKDYVLGWLLWGIAKHPILSNAWVLKGGAAIKKCYVDTHRYSQDLDFTVLPDGPWQPDELLPILSELLATVQQASGIDFAIEPPRFETRPHGESCEARIYYRGPRGNPGPTGAKLDITHAEDLMRPPVLRSISHPYSDVLPDNAQVYCYDFEELFAEKIRALGERARPGDLYDITYLFRRSDLHAEVELIREVLEHKCEFKEISVPTLEDVYSPERRDEISARWDSKLGRSVGLLPALDAYWNELPLFFAWLNGEEIQLALSQIPAEEAWKPPMLIWERGQSELIEPIRHAAVNRLLIDLGYTNKRRLVEPYSLRLTKSGNILFYARKAETNEIRSYRLDRIQSIEVTVQPFKPVLRIEFTPEGRIPIPLTRRVRRFISSSKARHYIIQCAICGKQFPRSKYSTRINPHQAKDYDIQCYGRYGFMA